MSIPALPSGLHPDDYERIEQAVMETARGRWFLLEYARRQRASEIERLVQAIGRLERRIPVRDESGAVSVSFEAIDLTNAARRARRLASKLRDFAWVLMERGLDEALCLEIEEFAREAAELVEAQETRVAPDIADGAIERTDARENAAGPDRGSDARSLPAEAADPRLIALSRLDHLSPSEKLALFC